LAVVAVTHNSSHAIGDWVDALEALGRRAELELCVVDSGSSPDERAFLREHVAPRVDVLCECPNLGYGGACNVGAARTSAPVLLFTNPDTLVRGIPDAVWQDAGIDRRLLGATKVSPGATHRHLGFASLPTMRFEVQELVLGSRRRGIRRTDEHPAWVSGSALLLSRADFDRIGGFTDQLFMYFEDADLCARHAAAGGVVAIAPDLLIDHGAGRSTIVADRDALGSALDTINRASARRFAALHGPRWHEPALYALLVVAYVPRRAAVALLGRRGRRGRTAFYVLDLLFPRRALRRLGAELRRG
jgi:GT2 family glycosyltransferase